MALAHLRPAVDLPSLVAIPVGSPGRSTIATILPQAVEEAGPEDTQALRRVLHPSSLEQYRPSLAPRLGFPQPPPIRVVRPRSLVLEARPPTALPRFLVRSRGMASNPRTLTMVGRHLILDGKTMYI